MINWKVVLPGFLITLFLIKYYDFFYLYLPIRTFIAGGDSQQTISSFTIYNYLLKASFYLLKFLLIATILSGGIFLEGNKNKLKVASIGDLYTLAMSAEFIFLLADMVKIIDFTFISTDYQDLDYLNYHPFSLFRLINVNPDSLFSYPLQSLNVFEFAYVGALGHGLKKLQFPNNNTGYRVVFFSYGSALVVWTVIISIIKSI